MGRFAVPGVRLSFATASPLFPSSCWQPGVPLHSGVATRCHLRLGFRLNAGKHRNAQENLPLDCKSLAVDTFKYTINSAGVKSDVCLIA